MIYYLYYKNNRPVSVVDWPVAAARRPVRLAGTQKMGSATEGFKS